MPVKAVKKPIVSLPDTLANPGLSNDGGLKKAALFRVDIAGNIQNKDAEGVFLLNPGMWDDSKSSNWVQHAVPGQSDPLMQWVSSGPRTVTFEALVTADTSDFRVRQSEKDSEKAKPKEGLEAVADLAMKLFKIQVPPPRDTSGDYSKPTEVLDISNHLNYYRSLLYPTYSDPQSKGVPQRLKQSPPLLVLLAGSSIARLHYSSRITNKHDVWVLTDLKIKVTKQLPNLAPMEAQVSFTLVQYNIRSFDRNRFYK